MRTKQQSSQCRVPRASLLIALTTIILFSCSQESLAQQWTTNGNNISATNSGNVGVGTTSPGSKLDVNGRIEQTGTFPGGAGYLLTNGDLLANTTTLNPGIAFYGGKLGVSTLYGADLGYNSSTGRYRTRLFSGHILGDVAFGRQENVHANPTQSAFIEFLTIRGDTGNVGIGTATPGYKLDVQGGAINASGGLCMAGNCKTDWAQVGGGSQWTTAGTSIFYSGSVGINTHMPVAKFHVAGVDLGGTAVFSGTGVSSYFNWNGDNSEDTYIRGGKSTSRVVINDTNSGNVVVAAGGGNVGVGTHAPGFKLDVQGGQVNASGGLCIAGNCKTNWAQINGDSQWTTAGTSIFYDTGNVGIGTSTPYANLQVRGVAAGGTAAFSGTNFTSHFNYNADNSEDTYIRGGKSTSRVVINDANSGNVVVAVGGGNVGVGTANPVRRLDLFHDIAGISFEAGTGTPNSGVIRFGDGSGWKLNFGRSRNGTTAPLNSGAAGVVMTIVDNGNVGIGTTAPGFKLDVAGEINATGLRINGTPISPGPGGAVSSVFGRTGAIIPQTGDYTWAQINMSASSLAHIATRSAGDLSSGTLPDARFPATLPTVSGANLTALNASNLASGTVPIARLGSGAPDSTKFLRGDNTWATPSGTSQWTTTVENDIFYNSGNVGVGTPSPTAKLEVVGNIKVSGNIAAKYQDVAEWVDSSQELVAGTVVVLDSGRSNHVIAATQSYDSRIAGVISLQPGLTLGEEAEGRVLVATTGRVRVKVDASGGPIQIGDLLVTSNREGFAMKSLPVDVGGVRMHRPGTLIGKALEPLTSGTGQILVLLSLQ